MPSDDVIKTAKTDNRVLYQVPGIVKENYGGVFGMNKTYLNNLKKHWVYAVPSLLFCLAELLIIVIFFKFGMHFLDKITDEYAKVLGLIVLLTAFVKIISWFGVDSISKFTANTQDIMMGKYR